ncbi:MAG: chemotaxis protein CheW [Bacteroidetes bacterium]|nr:chemotaxis protein CheW [Bacteroidota bacterium]
MAKNQNLDDLISRLEEKEKEASIIYADEETEQVVIFELGGSLFAFPGKQVFEITTFESITTVPGLPSYFSGLITLRGAVEAVVNLKYLLHLPSDSPIYGTRIIFLKSEDHVLGGLADLVFDVMAIPKSNIHPPLQTLDEAKAEYVIGDFEYKGKQVALLSITRIFSKIAELSKA